MIRLSTLPNLRFWATLFCVVLWAGCDNFGADEETVNIPKTVEFRFRFNADAVNENQPAILASVNRIDLDGQLDGFTKDQLETARVESARLVALFPLSESVAFLDHVILSITANELSSLEVASQVRFPASRNVLLEVSPERNLVAFLQENDFGASIRIETTSLQPGEDYELAVELVLSLSATVAAKAVSTGSYFTAIHEISMPTFFGRRATSTVALAGGSSGK